MCGKAIIGVCKKYISVILAMLCIGFAGCGGGETVIDGANTDKAPVSSVETGGTESSDETKTGSGSVTDGTGAEDPKGDNIILNGDEDVFDDENTVTVNADSSDKEPAGNGGASADADSADSDETPDAAENASSGNSTAGESDTTDRNDKGDNPDVTGGDKEQNSGSDNTGAEDSDNPDNSDETKKETTAPLIQVLPDGGLQLPDDEWE